MSTLRRKSQISSHVSAKRGANSSSTSAPFLLPVYPYYAKGYENELKAAFRTLTACRADDSLAVRDDLDQCPATIETTLGRLALLLDMSLLRNRRVLLLGDDDLLSVAIAATGIATQVTVVDLDCELLSRIEHWSKDAPIELLHHDLRLGLPDTLAHNYDAVFTDPPYTLDGQLVFLRASTNGIRNDNSSSLFLCSSRFYLSRPLIGKIIAAAKRAGLGYVGVEEDFNKYKAPPAVEKDLRRKNGQRNASYLYSSLFHFKPSGCLIKPETLTFAAAKIYEYGDQHGSS
jgi:hypothetical protein